MKCVFCGNKKKGQPVGGEIKLCGCGAWVGAKKDNESVIANEAQYRKIIRQAINIWGFSFNEAQERIEIKDAGAYYFFRLKEFIPRSYKSHRELVSQALRNSGLSLVDFAAESGVAWTTIWEELKGNRKPRGRLQEVWRGRGWI